MNDKKLINVVAYCDSPTCATGFATVSRNIFEGLYKTGRYNIDILGINYWGDPHQFPYRIWPVGFNPDNDPYGRKKICHMIPQMNFDILFVLQDTFIIDFAPDLINHLRSSGRRFKSIVYYPIDGAPKPEWLTNVSVFDHIVAYTEFGKNQTFNVRPDLKSKDIQIVPHGVNINDYFYITDRERVKAFRKHYFGTNSDKFIITNVNRNQRRKDIPRTIQAFVEFKKHVPNSLLYLHMAVVDQGWDLREVCRAYGLSTSTDVVFPDKFGPNQGYPREVLNFIYNASDCVVSTTLGEGFGLSWIEAMAAKTPVVMPNNTSMTEFITEDRGYLVKSGTSASLNTVLTSDNEVVRPLVDVEDLVETLLKIYNNRPEALQKAENAYTWVRKELEWSGSITPKWIDLFDASYEELINNVNVGQTESVIKSEVF